MELQPTNISNGSTGTTSSEAGAMPNGPETLVGCGGAGDTTARRADQVTATGSTDPVADDSGVSVGADGKHVGVQGACAGAGGTVDGVSTSTDNGSVSAGTSSLSSVHDMTSKQKINLRKGTRK